MRKVKISPAAADFDPFGPADPGPPAPGYLRRNESCTGRPPAPLTAA